MPECLGSRNCGGKLCAPSSNGTHRVHDFTPVVAKGALEFNNIPEMRCVIESDDMGGIFFLLSRHISRRFFRMRAAVLAKEFILRHVGNDEGAADGLTKFVGYAKFISWRQQMAADFSKSSD